MKQDIVLPYKKEKKSKKTSLKKFFKKIFKDPPKNTLVRITTYAGIIIGIVAFILALIPTTSTFGLWLAVLAVAVELFGFFKKDGLLPRRMLVASIAVLVIAVGSVTIQNIYQQSLIDHEMYLQSGDATEEILSGDLTINFGEWSEQGLEVILKNHNPDNKGYNVLVAARGQDDLPITSEMISVGGIAPGSEVNITIFKKLSESQKNTMKNARYEVVSVSQY